jgi:secondary thiamine-phosphate synthase enzyme
MKIINKIIDYPTDTSIGIYNLRDRLETEIAAAGITNGHVLVFSRHTTTAIAINEYEERLLEDIKVYLSKLAPESDRYLHNDLHLRDVPPDEPINAHSHLMAMTMNNSEIVPIIDGKLGLGTYQSVLLLELDGPRQRTVLLQICGV